MSDECPLSPWSQAWFGVSLPGGPRHRAERAVDYLKLLEREALHVRDPELARCLLEARGFFQGLLVQSRRLPSQSAVLFSAHS